MSKRKISSGSPNSELANMLMEIAEYEKNVTKQIHKYNAYKRAARAIRACSKKISSADEARKLDGVGVKIAEKIDQYLTSGTIAKLVTIRKDDEAQIMSTLTKVSGIGPAAAKKFIAEGVKSLSDLKKKSSKLTAHQKIGLKYYDDFQLKIPREEIMQVEKFLVKEIDTVDINYLVEIVGSYRRGAQVSGDVDVLLTHPNYTSKVKPKNMLSDVIKHLEDTGFLVETLALGETKYMGVYQIKLKGAKESPHRRIDIRLFPHDQYYCAVVHFTGSDMFNKHLRTLALEAGYTLNEYCIRKIGITGVPGEPLPVYSEKDIFDYIKTPYKPPSERNA